MSPLVALSLFLAASPAPKPLPPRPAPPAVHAAAAAPASAPVAPAATPAAPVASAATGPYCSGEYAEDMASLSPAARAFEERQPPYTFCIRTSAVYECPFYGSDGELHRVRKRVVAHGTGFAYRQQDGGTLLLTNDHVAEWPLATDDDHTVEGVPAGCRRVSDALKIVDGEDDDYAPDDVPLTRVVTDPQLDMAVLRSKKALPIMPWKIGRSAALRERDVVNVRGFPLGIMKADNVGKVVSAYDHDDYKDWDHDDFVIDALLSPGNSGSPVFAISCKTGEFELVGVYHAAYSEGSALNVAVGIDQVRDLMTTLRRSPRPHDGGAPPDRAALVAAASATLDPFFPFGTLVASARARPDGALYFQVFSADYPTESWPLLVVEDLPGTAPGTFGPLGRVWIGSPVGLKAYARADLDAETQASLTRVLDALRRDATAAFEYRAAETGSNASKAQFEHAQRLQNVVRRAVAKDGLLSQSVADLADRLRPGFGDRTVALADVLAPPPPPPAAPAAPPPAVAPVPATDAPARAEPATTAPRGAWSPPTSTAARSSPASRPAPAGGGSAGP